MEVILKLCWKFFLFFFYSLEDARIANIDPVADNTVAAFALRMKDYKFRACGVGVIGNYGERSKGVCSEVDFITDPTMCKEQYAAAADPSFNNDPEFYYCLRWPSRDNNACVGDSGGPVYAYKLDSKGAIDAANQKVVCTITSSPNVRKGSPCLDGHITLCIVSSGDLDNVNINSYVNFLIFTGLL